MKYFVALLTAILALPILHAQPAPQVVVHVSEGAGIRRAMYPVNARVPFARGALTDASHVRLLLKGAEVPAQIQAETRWPDGSVEWLDVDFNASIGPIETVDYTVEYGPTVSAQAPPRGLVVSDGPDTIQVGNVTFGKNASPLIRSVKYRDEDIGTGANGISFVDTAATTHEFVMDSTSTVNVIKPGPLYVVLEYRGRVAVLDATYPVVLRVEMPSSKTWVKVYADVQAPVERIRSMAFQTPLAFGPYPWLWDFGTSKGTYGVLRTATDQATLTQTVKATKPVTSPPHPDEFQADWRVDLSTGGRPLQVTEIGAADEAAAQWGHIQDGKEAIAFALVHPFNQTGISTMDVDGAGRLEFRVMFATNITVYEHFVTSPSAIGAATSPAAMLAPLTAVCDQQQYESSGVGVLVR